MGFDLPMCFWCKHFVKGQGKRRPKVCTAFPEGIPAEIYRNEYDHRLPHEGDHGIQFEPADDAQSQAMAAYLAQFPPRPPLDKEKVKALMHRVGTVRQFLLQILDEAGRRELAERMTRTESFEELPEQLRKAIQAAERLAACQEGGMARSAVRPEPQRKKNGG
jgi:hypothetical protein